MITDNNIMGKVEKSTENVPGLSPQAEASKLLEQALMQMDGIINSGSGSLGGTSPEFGFGPAGVREAAAALAAALRTCPLPQPPAEAAVSATIMGWLQQTQVSKLPSSVSTI